MPRRGFVSKRVVSPDPVYNDVLVAKMIHAIMLDGKARVAENVVYGSWTSSRKRTKEDPVAVMKKAIENVKPVVEVKSRRVGGATYQVRSRSARNGGSPPLDPLAGRVRAERAEKTMVQRLSGELLDAYNNRGNTFKKKEDTHKMAEANKAFAHYRW